MTTPKTLGHEIQKFNIHIDEMCNIIKDIKFTVDGGEEIYNLGNTINRLEPNPIVFNWKHNLTTSYEDSIGYKYIMGLLKKYDNKLKHDPLLLMDIVEEHCKDYPKADPDKIYVHVRTGDRIKISHKYVENKSLFESIYKEKLIELIEDIEIKKIVLVAGLHYPVGFTKQDIENEVKYFTDLISFLKGHGCSVEICSNKNPDKDFYILTTAKYAIGLGKCSFFNEALYINKTADKKLKISSKLKYDKMAFVDSLIDFDTFLYNRNNSNKLLDILHSTNTKRKTNCTIGQALECFEVFEYLNYEDHYGKKISDIPLFGCFYPQESLYLPMLFSYGEDINKIKKFAIEKKNIEQDTQYLNLYNSFKNIKRPILRSQMDKLYKDIQDISPHNCDEESLYVYIENPIGDINSLVGGVCDQYKKLNLKSLKICFVLKSSPLYILDKKSLLSLVNDINIFIKEIKKKINDVELLFFNNILDVFFHLVHVKYIIIVQNSRNLKETFDLGRSTFRHLIYLSSIINYKRFTNLLINRDDKYNLNYFNFSNEMNNLSSFFPTHKKNIKNKLKLLIVIATNPGTGSTLLTNIIYGLFKPQGFLAFKGCSDLKNKNKNLWNNIINDQIYFPLINDDIIIIKSHHSIEGIKNINKNINILCIGIDRTGVAYNKVDNNEEEFDIIFNYDELLETPDNPISKIISNVYDKLSSHLPDCVKKIHNKRSAKNRIDEMNQEVSRLSKYPFSINHSFFSIHGHHKNRKWGKIDSIDLPETLIESLNSFKIRLDDEYKILNNIKIINNKNSNSIYPLGNIIRDLDGCSVVRSIVNKTHIINKNSIGYKYIIGLLNKYNNRLKHDPLLLMDIVEEHCKDYPKADPDKIYVHVRTGDRIKLSSSFLENKSLFEGNYKEKLIELIEDVGIKKIVLVTALHYPNYDNYYVSYEDGFTKQDIENEVKYFTDLISFLKGHGCSVEICSNKNPDKDFYILTTAKYAIGLGKCSFSAIAFALNENKNTWLIHNENHPIKIKKGNDFLVICNKTNEICDMLDSSLSRETTKLTIGKGLDLLEKKYNITSDNYNNSSKDIPVFKLNQNILKQLCDTNFNFHTSPYKKEDELAIFVILPIVNTTSLSNHILDIFKKLKVNKIKLCFFINLSDDGIYDFDIIRDFSSELEEINKLTLSLKKKIKDIELIYLDSIKKIYTFLLDSKNSIISINKSQYEQDNIGRHSILPVLRPIFITDIDRNHFLLESGDCGEYKPAYVPEHFDNDVVREKKSISFILSFSNNINNTLLIPILKSLLFKNPKNYQIKRITPFKNNIYYNPQTSKFSFENLDKEFNDLLKNKILIYKKSIVQSYIMTSSQFDIINGCFVTIYIRDDDEITMYNVFFDNDFLKINKNRTIQDIIEYIYNHLVVFVPKDTLLPLDVDSCTKKIDELIDHNKNIFHIKQNLLELYLGDMHE